MWYGMTKSRDVLWKKRKKLGAELLLLERWRQGGLGLQNKVAKLDGGFEIRGRGRKKKAWSIGIWNRISKVVGWFMVKTKW